MKKLNGKGKSLIVESKDIEKTMFLQERIILVSKDSTGDLQLKCPSFFPGSGH